MMLDLDALTDLDTADWGLDGFTDVLDLDAPVDLDSATYGLNGEPLTVFVEAVPRVRYRELVRPRFREQRHPVYEEATQ